MIARWRLPRQSLSGWLVLVAVMMGCYVPSVTIAQDARSANNKSSQNEQREKLALDFVRRHHPPLQQVLIYLKENHRSQYEKAIYDLERTRNRLAQFKKRSPERYQLELKEWQVKSEIQLISARLATEDTQHLRSELAKAVSKQVNLRISILQWERESSTKRLQRLELSLEQLQQKRDQEIERLTNQLFAKVKRMNRTTPAKKTDSKKRNSKNKKTKTDG